MSDWAHLMHYLLGKRAFHPITRLMHFEENDFLWCSTNLLVIKSALQCLVTLRTVCHRPLLLAQCDYSINLRCIILFAFYDNEISCCCIPSDYDRLLLLISLRLNTSTLVTVYRRLIKGMLRV